MLCFIQHRDRYYIIISSWLFGNMAFSISRYRHYLFIDAFLKGTQDTAISIELTQSNIHEYNISVRRGEGHHWVNETLFMWRTRGGNGKKGVDRRKFTIPALTPRLFLHRDFYLICLKLLLRFASLSVSLSEFLVLD